MNEDTRKLIAYRLDQAAETLDAAGECPMEYGRHLQEAFELRQGCDYREFVQITLEQVQETVAKAEAFLHYTQQVLSNTEG
jgi:uncharacterized protein (UPF0332 family)